MEARWLVKRVAGGGCGCHLAPRRKPKSAWASAELLCFSHVEILRIHTHMAGLAGLAGWRRFRSISFHVLSVMRECVSFDFMTWRTRTQTHLQFKRRMQKVEDFKN